MKSATYVLACSELEKYGISAELRLNEELPSFEISATGGKAVISAPDELELLYGVYDFAERFGGWSFFEVGRDRFDAGCDALRNELLNNGREHHFSMTYYGDLTGEMTAPGRAWNIETTVVR